MEETRSERRLAENEIVFRQLNEQVHAGYAETNKFAREDNQQEFVVKYKTGDAPLQFYCECADEKCAKRIPINIHDYHDIHEHRNRFIILPRHEVASIEKVVLKQPEYWVVEKVVNPPESADRLHPTPLNNS